MNQSSTEGMAPSLTLFTVGVFLLMVIPMAMSGKNDEHAAFVAKQKVLRQTVLKNFVNAVEKEVFATMQLTKLHPLKWIDGSRHLPTSIRQDIINGADLDAALADTRYALRASIRARITAVVPGGDENLVDYEAASIERPFIDIFNRIYHSETTESLESVSAEIPEVPLAPLPGVETASMNG